MHRFKWSFDKGNKIIIGQDHTMGVCNSTHLSEDTIVALHHRGLFFLEQVVSRWNGLHPIWKAAEKIGLHGYKALEWNGYIHDLRQARLCRNTRGESLIWDGILQQGSIMVAYNYKYIMSIKYISTIP